MSVLASFLKDPSDVLDYTLDWSEHLGADTITGTPTWSVPGGISLQAQSNTTTLSTAWFAGGTAGTDYTVTCRIETTGGRTIERSIMLRVRDL